MCLWAVKCKSFCFDRSTVFAIFDQHLEVFAIFDRNLFGYISGLGEFVTADWWPRARAVTAIGLGTQADQ